MASVWKRLQRVNKRAAKFQYTASYHRIDLETTAKWKPNKLSVVWTRRSRRVITEPLEWEPSLKDPFKGSVIWAVPENQTVAVTLFKDPRTNDLEDKDWTFVLEDVAPSGKRRRLAVAPLNMRRYASLESSQSTISVTLQTTTAKIVSAAIQLTISCVLLREGQATDEDMQSLASLLSTNLDIATLGDFDEDDSISDNSSSLKQVLDLRQQMEQMTSSLTGSELQACTPISIQSLTSDNSRTPTAPRTPSGFNSLATSPLNEGFQGVPTSTPKVLGPEEAKLEGNSQNPFETLSNSEVNSGKAVMTGGLRGVKLIPTHLSKRNLKPLELKVNLNSIGLELSKSEIASQSPTSEGDATPVSAVIKLRAENDRDKTPVQDLLEWCKEVTREYRQCKVTNLTTSWRNGLAFCAIIHHHRPDLIDFSSLQVEEAETNLRIALEASNKLGIPPILAPADFCHKPVPDRLVVMTYLFQLRTHFTGGELKVEQLGNDPQESSYMVGRHDTDGDMPARVFSMEIASARKKRETGNTKANPYRTSLSSQESVESQNSQDCVPAPPAPVFHKERSPSAKDRASLVSQSKSLINKMLSPTKERVIKDFGNKDQSADVQTKSTSVPRWRFSDPLGASKEPNVKPVKEPAIEPVKPAVEPVKPVMLMTRQQLQNPFDSDEEDEVNTGQGQTQEILRVPTDGKPETKQQPAEPEPTNNVFVSQTVNKRDTRSLSPSESLPKPTQQLLSRHDELKERARQLLEATKREAREKEANRRTVAKEEKFKKDQEKEVIVTIKNGGSPQKLTDEQRQTQLLERARQLIANARAGITSPTSPTSPGRNSKYGVVEIISRQSMLDEIAAAGGIEQLDNILAGRDSEYSPDEQNNVISDMTDDTKESPERNGNESQTLNKRLSESPNKRSSESPNKRLSESPNKRLSESPNKRSTESPTTRVSESPSKGSLQSFSRLIERLSPEKDLDEDFMKEDLDDSSNIGSYIQSEIEALEREQSSIDQQAALLEKELRRVMESSNSNEEEDALMTKWFTLVNKKNALIRRQNELNILEREKDLCRRCQLLESELRSSLAVEEWRKGAGQRRRDQLLLRELLSAVDERDRLVHEMDTQERAIEDDDEIQRNLSQVEIQRKNNCILQ